jgi:hypothetical protein
VFPCEVITRRAPGTIDPDIGCLHEGAHGPWLGPPKTPASARTITLPPFLITLIRKHLESHDHEFAFPALRGCWRRRSDFDRRVFRLAIDSNLHKADPPERTYPVWPGLTFHGLRHSHKTWLIPDIAQAQRLGHHLAGRLAEVYSHVALEIEADLLKALERRWYHAHQTRHPADNRPHRKPTTLRSAPRAPHSAPALRTVSTPRRPHARPQLTAPRTVHMTR